MQMIRCQVPLNSLDAVKANECKTFSCKDVKSGCTRCAVVPLHLIFSHIVRDAE